MPKTSYHESAKAFLNFLATDFKEMPNEISHLDGLAQGIRDFIKRTQEGEEKFSIPDLIYLVDKMIVNCDHLKNQLIDIKERICIQRVCLHYEAKRTLQDEIEKQEKLS